MENLRSYDNNENKERQKTLKKIRDYILSLLIKKQSKAKEIEKVLQETPKTEEIAEEKSIWEKLKEKILNENDKPPEKKEDQKPNESQLESSPEDQDEYIPRNSEFGESLGEANRFGEIYPPFLGYYTQGKKSYFDPNTNLRSKKKKLSAITNILNSWIQKYNYAGIIKAGISSIPLPEWALPDTESLCFDGSKPPLFQIDQNNCIYLVSDKQQRISFNFGLHQIKNDKEPIPQDQENIIFKALSHETESLLKSLRNGPINLSAASKIKQHIIKTKKYSTKVQGTLRDKSNKRNYLQHIEESPILECFSANTLFVGLCRSLGLKSRLIVGHMVQNTSKSWKAFVGSNTGHARSEVWDESKNERVRFDATPTEKDEKDKKPDEDKENNEEKNNQDADDNFDEDQESQNTQDAENGEKSDKEGKDGEKSDQESDSDENQESSELDQKSESDQESDKSKKKQKEDVKENKQKQQPKHKEKSASQLLDELIQKAKEDSLTQNAEKIKEVLDKIEKSQDKKEVKKALEEAGLEDFAKDLVDKVGNDRILEEEKEEMKNIEDEKELEQKLRESLLDDEYKRKLKEYAETIKERIEEQKRKMKSEMERFGFKDEELALYKQYKALEQEVMPEVRRQIEELKRILPPQYLINRDEERYYNSGARLDRNKLVDRKVNGETKLFQRSKIEMDSQEINMFETIIIDRSGSMGSFADRNSPFFQSIKAAITRAKVLEYFKVDMSIVIFDDTIDEVMSFGESFSERRTKIPSKLMRAATTRSWGNSQEPITHVYHKMKERMRLLGGKSFGNISFIGDGDIYNFNQVTTLKAMIEDLKRQGMGVTAYYINKEQTKMPLIEYYFWKPEDGNAIYAKDTTDLSAKLISNHKNKLNLLIKKYLKQA